MAEQRVFYRTVGHRRAMLRGGQTFSWIFYVTLRNTTAPATDEEVSNAARTVRAFAIEAPDTAAPAQLLAPFMDTLGKAVIPVYEVGIDDGLDVHMLRNEPAAEEKPLTYKITYLNPITRDLVEP